MALHGQERFMTASEDGVQYNGGAETDLEAASPTGKHAARMWTVLAADASASLVVETARGEERTYSADLLVGQLKTIALKKIKSTTHASVKILVQW